ncbi:MAG: type II toxin-antitoxin system RelE/ParE family toxin [Anaerolineales bacterium]|nr:type II toxin-antitoxin system RelE/ParE family toxin [Anaerolineales bacterium]
MASYRIEWKKSAGKELRKLPADVIQRVVNCVSGLSTNPYPSGSRKLVGSEFTFRVRVGDYRILYNVFDDQVIVEIIRVAHRKDVYR